MVTQTSPPFFFSQCMRNKCGGSAQRRQQHDATSIPAPQYRQALERRGRQAEGGKDEREIFVFETRDKRAHNDHRVCPSAADGLLHTGGRAGWRGMKKGEKEGTTRRRLACWPSCAGRRASADACEPPIGHHRQRKKKKGKK